MVNQPGDPYRHLLSSTEAYFSFSWNLHYDLWHFSVSTHSCLTGHHIKNTEVAKFHCLSLRQCLDDTFQRLANNGLSILKIQWAFGFASRSTYCAMPLFVSFSELPSSYILLTYIYYVQL